MKNTFTTILFTVFAVFIVQAKNPIKPEKENFITEMDGYGIPEEVSNWLTKELSNSSTAVLESFDTPEFYTSKNAKIIGYIKGYDKTQGAKTGMFYYDNELTRENKPRVIEIYKDGRFELELPLEYPTKNYFVLENKAIQFYIEPGQNLSITMNWEDLKAKRNSYIFKKVEYQGVLEKINTDLLHYGANYPHKKLYKMKDEMEALDYKKEMYSFKNLFLKKIKAYKESGDINAKTNELLTNEVKLIAYKNMFDYFTPSNKRKLKKNGINMEGLVPEGYYDFIQEIPLNKQSLLVNKEFDVFMNRLEYSPMLELAREKREITTGIFSKDFITFLESKQKIISLKERELVKGVNKELLEGKKISEELDVKATNFYEKHDKEVKEYLNSDKMKTLDNNRFKNREIEKWKKKDSLAKQINIKDKLVYDIIKSRTIEFNLLRSNNSNELKKWWWSFMKENIKSPHLKKLGDDMLTKALSQLDVYELPKNEKGTAIFKKLIAPYKDKIVIVQFWNPHTYYKGNDVVRVKKRRELYKGNDDIVFLFIANKGRLKISEYEKRIKENDFENTLLIPQDDHHYMRQLFRFNSSIENVLIDKNGCIVNGFETHYMESFLKEKLNISPVVK